MTTPPPAPADRLDRGRVAAWCLFDWANSAFPALVMTFIFATYFTKAVAPTPEQGTALWGWAMGAAGLGIAVLAPVGGAIADQAGRRKPWLAATLILCAGCTAGLWWVTPDPGSVPLALILVAVATVAFETGMAFYNALLPAVAPPRRLGAVSGWGWGLGYAGGLVLLVVALVGFVQADPAPFGLDPARAEPVRATMLLAALWMAVFALPLFLMVPERPRSRPAGSVVRRGLADLAGQVAALRRDRVLGWFLLAQMLYLDGLNTLFAFGGIYAAGTFGMGLDEIILLGIALNVTSGLGAAVFGWLDDRLGARWIIVVGVAAMTGLGIGLLLVSSKVLFWALVLPLGLFFGPVQSGSRTLMARIAPEERRAELFGLAALSGKVTAFAGPMLLAWVTVVSGSQRVGMATILLFLIAGLAILLTRVKP
ncbi:MFS transporter [Novispirillum itersonii]|uniref:MFS transporter n=1 Tax=Novispirillum itersonii TaxID=189 RepID=UPI0003716258|nr:MFS transporter [Novispirillum itersonii]